MIILQVSAKVGPIGNVIEINTMFMYSVNSVLWRLITGRPIEPQTASRITLIIREAFRVAERSSISDILQVRDVRVPLLFNFLFKTTLQMTTSWCIPLYKSLGMGKRTAIGKFEPMRNFVAEVISAASADSEGNFIEQQKDEMRNAQPGSRFG